MICFEDTHGWKITSGEEPRHLCAPDRSCLALSSPKARISVKMNFVYNQGYSEYHFNEGIKNLFIFSWEIGASVFLKSIYWCE